MTWFISLKAPGVLTAISYSKVHFYDDKTQSSFFYDRNDKDIPFGDVKGMSLLQFQLYLEKLGGSILVPITRTKDNYVYIPGQRDYRGRIIG
jgi:hypothetical protein